MDVGLLWSTELVYTVVREWACEERVYRLGLMEATHLNGRKTLLKGMASFIPSGHGEASGPAGAGERYRPGGPRQVGKLLSCVRKPGG